MKADKRIGIEDIGAGVDIYYCEKHGEYYSNSCSNCMVDDNEEDIKKAGIKEVVEWGREHGWHPSPSILSLFTDEWEEKLIEWGVESE